MYVLYGQAPCHLQDAFVAYLGQLLGRRVPIAGGRHALAGLDLPG